MKLIEGMMAKDFATVDVYGREVKLSDYKGKKIILGFYRNVSCPFCNRRIHRMMSYQSALQKKDVQLVFMFESNPEKLKASVLHNAISPWPLISDHEKIIYKQYGVEQSFIKQVKTLLYGNLSEAKKELSGYAFPEDKDATLNLIPADFFINENFFIEKAHYGAHIDDHIDIEEVKKFANIV